MKKSFFLTLILMNIGIVAFANDDVITIPDAGFRNALLNVDVVDTDGDESLDSPVDRNGDGKIQKREAEAVKVLNVFREDISSLEGIEYFINLEQLWCGKNQIKELDFSLNPKLRILYCNHNELTKLNVSSNTKLEFIHAQANLLTSLDVSNCTVLEYLIVDGSQIATLDVSKNLKLKELHCSGNQLTSLDVSANTYLRKLDCSYNKITSLDLRANKWLTNIKCNKNELTKLNVASGNNVAHLQILDARDNSNLKIIFVDKPSYAKKQDFWFIDDAYTEYQKY